MPANGAVSEAGMIYRSAVERLGATLGVHPSPSRYPSKRLFSSGLLAPSQGGTACASPAGQPHEGQGSTLPGAGADPGWAVRQRRGGHCNLRAGKNLVIWSLETRLSVEIFAIYLGPLAEVDRHIMQGRQLFWEAQESLPPREFPLTRDDCGYILWVLIAG